MKRKRKLKKLLAILMSVIMTMSTVNLSVFASDADPAGDSPAISGSEESGPGSPIYKCGKTEHTHVDTCYTEPPVLNCAEEHDHTGECYLKVPTCGIEEHTHTDECLAGDEESGGDSDEESDLEKQKTEGQNQEGQDTEEDGSDKSSAKLEDWEHYEEMSDALQKLSDEIGDFMSEFSDSFVPDTESPDPGADFNAAFAEAAGEKFGEEFNALLDLYKTIPEEMKQGEAYEGLTGALEYIANTLGGDLSSGIMVMAAGSLVCDSTNFTPGKRTISSGNHTVTVSGTWKGTLTISGTGTTTIKGGGKIDATGLGSSAIIINSGATVILENATVTGGIGTNKTDAGMEPRSPNTFRVGGGVYVEKGTFELNGGTITGNTAQRGGGIFIANGSTFTMTSGSVENNQTVDGDHAKFAGEGGGIFVLGTATISGGQIINNTCNSQTDLGGGGLYINNNGKATLINATVTNNTAWGFGGGIAGCCHGEASLVATDGVALYGNEANGTNHTIADGKKGAGGVNEIIDHYNASTEEGIKGGNSKDFYTAGSSIISNYMAGGGSAMYEGIIGGKKVSIRDEEIRKEETTNIGLVAHPTQESKDKVPEGVLISGNTSHVHGGGIGCNGGLYFGSSEDQEIVFNVLNLTLNAKKTLTGEKLQADQYTFVLQYSDGTTAATATNDADGNITFKIDNFVNAKEYINNNSITFYMLESAGKDGGIVYDRSVYKVDVELNVVSDSDTVELKHTTTNNHFKNIKVTYTTNTYTATKTTISQVNDKDGNVLNPPTEVGAINFTNEAVGNLAVTKTVTGNGGEKDKDWNFQVKLGDENINGKYGDMTFEDGVASFTLKSGGSMTATNLPVGVSYTVTEAEEGQDGYKTTKTGETGKIAKGQTATAAFTNDRKGGSLTIEKAIEVPGGNKDTFKDKVFTFTVTGPNGYNETVTITGEGSQKLDDLVPGTYTVKENDANVEGYLWSSNGKDGVTVAVEADKPDNPGSHITVPVTNTYVEKTSIDVEKYWIETNGETATEDLPTELEIELYQGISSNNMDKIKSLKLTADGGWKGTFDDLPKYNDNGKKYIYEVVEVEADGWVITKSSSQTEEDGHAKHTFTNKRHAGSLRLEKIVNANGNNEAGEKEFKFLVQGPNDYEETVTLKAGAENAKLLDHLVPGKYTVTEVREGAEISGWNLEVTGEGTNIVTANKTTSIEVTNTYTKQVGSLKITKHVVGGPKEASESKEYKFTVTGPEGYSESVTVTGEGTAELKGLNPGTYTVTEERTDAEIPGWNLEVTGGGEVTVPGNGSAETEVTNSYTEKLGSLTITKTVEGAQEETSGKRYMFTVSAPGYVESKTIAAGETATFDKLKFGTYTIEEQNAPVKGYDLERTWTVDNVPAIEKDGKIQVNIADEEHAVAVAITNTYKPLGSLTVTKTVKGNEGETDRDWHFTVTLSDSSINGPYGDMVFENGVAIVTLNVKKGEDSKTATDLPVGIEYTVTEQEANADGYETGSAGDTGEIVAEGATAAFTNIKGNPHKTEIDPGNKKTVKVGDRITYRIDWLNWKASKQNVTVVDPLDQYVDYVSSSDGGVYDKAAHKVTWDLGEKESGEEGFVTLTVEVNLKAAKRPGNTVYNQGEVRVGNEGEFRLTEIPENRVEVGKLTVKKFVNGQEGEGPDTKKDWHFTVTLSNKNINGYYGDMLFENGEAHFTLKHGEEITAEKLPAGITYEVTEEEADKDGYNTTITGAEGTISDNNTATAIFYNDSQPSPHKIEMTPGDGKSVKVGQEITYEIKWVNWKKDEQKVTINDPLDKGVDYVSSSDNGVYDKADHKVTWDLGTRASGEEGFVTLTVRVNEKAAQRDRHTVYNQADVYNGAEFKLTEIPENLVEIGGLTVTKEVTGDGNRNQEFNFTVTLSDTNVNGFYGEMNFKNGVAEFTLKHGESKSASRLPAGITYEVEEQEANAGGYTTYMEGEKGTIENDKVAETKFVNDRPTPTPTTYPDTISITVNKVWAGDEDANVRPTSITVQLYRDGAAYGSPVILSDPSWTYTWSGLPESGDYSVVEQNVPTGYTSLVDQNGRNFTITNTWNPVPLSGALNVTKVWKGDNAKVRPDSIEVQLYKDGETDGDPVTLNEENDWSYSWTELDPEAKYTVEEADVPEGYKSSVEADEDGINFTITNTYDDDEELEKLPDPDVPLANMPSEPSKTTVTTIPNPSVPLASRPSSDSSVTIEDTAVPLGDAPKTGDESPIALWTVLMLGSLLSAAMIRMYLAAKRREQGRK